MMSSFTIITHGGFGVLIDNKNKQCQQSLTMINLLKLLKCILQLVCTKSFDWSPRRNTLVSRASSPCSARHRWCGLSQINESINKQIIICCPLCTTSSEMDLHYVGLTSQIYYIPLVIAYHSIYFGLMWINKK